MGLSYRAKRGNLLPRVSGLKKDVEFRTEKMGRALSKILGRAEASFSRLVLLWKIAGVSVTNAIIEKTPKDTGAAKASWQAPKTKESRDRFEIHIGSSGVDYIVFLEFGTSKQAPKGMVRVSLDEFIRALPKFADRITRFIAA